MKLPYFYSFYGEMNQIEEFIRIAEKDLAFENAMELAIERLQAKLSEYRSIEEAKNLKVKLMKKFPEYYELISTIYNVVDETSSADYYISESYKVYAIWNGCRLCFSKSYTGSSDYSDNSPNIYVNIGDEEFIVREDGVLITEEDGEDLSKLSTHLKIPLERVVEFIFRVVRA